MQMSPVFSRPSYVPLQACPVNAVLHSIFMVWNVVSGVCVRVCVCAHVCVHVGNPSKSILSAGENWVVVKPLLQCYLLKVSIPSFFYWKMCPASIRKGLTITRKPAYSPNWNILLYYNCIIFWIFFLLIPDILKNILCLLT